LGTRNRAVGVQTGFALGVVGLRGGEQRRGMDDGDATTGIEGDGDFVGGDDVWEFGDGEDVVRVLGEVGVEQMTAEGLNGETNSGEGIDGIFHESVPGGAGKTDLVGKAAQWGDLSGGREVRVGTVCAWRGEKSRGK